METYNVEKKPFYKGKAFTIPVAIVFALVLVSAAVVTYFHTVQVDLTVNEARSSADLPVALTFNSGETVTTDKIIHNSANVQLCAVLSWEETANANGVAYTNNLPITVTLPAGVDTTTTVSFTADEVTEAGAVTGNINYAKVACV